MNTLQARRDTTRLDAPTYEHRIHPPTCTRPRTSVNTRSSSAIRNDRVPHVSRVSRALVGLFRARVSPRHTHTPCKHTMRRLFNRKQLNLITNVETYRLFALGQEKSTRAVTSKEDDVSIIQIDAKLVFDYILLILKFSPTRQFIIDYNIVLYRARARA